jgi:hypothetical protein
MGTCTSSRVASTNESPSEASQPRRLWGRAQEIPIPGPPNQDDYDGFGGNVEQSVHENDYLSKVDSDAEGWAESERERELMAVLVEAAHLRSAARAWYRVQGVDHLLSRQGEPVREVLR